MRVLTFTSLFPNNIRPQYGVFVKERMVRVASQLDHQLRVIAPVPYYPPLDWGHRAYYSRILRRETIEGIPVEHPRYLMTPKIGMQLYGYLMALGSLRTVHSVQHQFPFDLIDAHYLYPDGYAAMLIARRLKKPFSVTVRGTDVNLYPQFRTIKPLLKSTLSRSSGVISVCQALKDAVVSLGTPSAQVTVIPNGVDSAKFHPLAQSAARTDLGLPSDRPILLSVGALVARKGLDILIRALHDLQKRHRHSNLFLAIVGGGEEQARLQTLAQSLGLSSSVRLVGTVAHHDLYRWYSAADLFCLASDREGWPNVILEAMACGAPVVAANIWGVPEIVRSDEHGFLCERTPAAFSATIDRALRRSWNRDALVAFAGRHTWERVAASVIDVFRRIVTNHGQAGD